MDSSNFSLKKITYFLIFIMFFLSASCREKFKAGEFVLEGKLKNSDTIKQVVLTYLNSNNNIFKDTLSIINNEFSAKGEINGAINVSLKGNMLTDFVDDPNFVFFFIEPNKKTTIILEENNFKEASIEGSKTQDEYEILNSKEAPIYALIAQVVNERNKLTAKGDFASNRFIKLRDMQQKKLNEIRAIRLDYMVNNPSSYLSPFYLNWYFQSMSLDSARTFYDKLDKKVKYGYYGTDIKNRIEKSLVKSKIGDKAPDFKLVDANGNTVMLSDYKGKYLLLDFWASWCGPCRENSSSIIQLFKKFNPKGFEVLGIATENDKQKWKSAIEADGVGIWKHALVGSNNTFGEEYNFKAIPAYVLIDKDGIIIGRFLAEEDYGIVEKLDKRLSELLND